MTTLELSNAIVRKNLPLVQKLLDEGADPNSIPGTNFPWPPLHRAIINGQTEMLAPLAKAGADIHLADRSGTTPLLTALRLGAADMADILTTLGATIGHSEKAGEPILQAHITQFLTRAPSDDPAEMVKRENAFVRGGQWIIERDPAWDRPNSDGAKALARVAHLPAVLSAWSAVIARVAMKSVIHRTATSPRAE